MHKNFSLSFSLCSIQLKARIPLRLNSLLHQLIAHHHVARLHLLRQVDELEAAFDVLLDRINFILEMPHRIEIAIEDDIIIAPQLVFETFFERAFRTATAENGYFLAAFGDVEGLKDIRFTLYYARKKMRLG